MSFAIETVSGETIECCFDSAMTATEKAKEYDRETFVKEVSK